MHQPQITPVNVNNEQALRVTLKRPGRYLFNAGDQTIFRISFTHNSFNQIVINVRDNTENTTIQAFSRHSCGVQTIRTNCLTITSSPVINGVKITFPPRSGITEIVQHRPSEQQMLASNNRMYRNQSTQQLILLDERRDSTITQFSCDFTLL